MVWLDILQKQIQVRGKARRYRAYQHVLFVSCRAVTARETPRRRKFLFGATNKSSDEDVKKKRSVLELMEFLCANARNALTQAATSEREVFNTICILLYCYTNIITIHYIKEKEY